MEFDRRGINVKWNAENILLCGRHAMVQRNQFHIIFPEDIPRGFMLRATSRSY